MQIEDDDGLRRIYGSTRRIAIVGASADEEKPGNQIPRYLQQQGFEILPINPKGGQILGRSAFASLDKVEGPVDVVDVFRPAEEAPAIAHAAVAAGAKVLWLQTGIVSEEAEQIASDGGLDFVMDKCMGRTYARLGLGPSLEDA